MCRDTDCSGRVIRRHNDVVALLARSFKSIRGMRAATDARINNTTEHAADLRVSYAGETVFLDVGITSVATPSMVRRESHLRTDVAGDAYYTRKIDKYAHLFQQYSDGDGRRALHGFIPFIIESGGRVTRRTVKWLDEFLGRSAEMEDRKARIYRQLSSILDRHHGRMIYSHHFGSDAN